MGGVGVLRPVGGDRDPDDAVGQVVGDVGELWSAVALERGEDALVLRGRCRRALARSMSPATYRRGDHFPARVGGRSTRRDPEEPDHHCHRARRVGLRGTGPAPRAARRARRARLRGADADPARGHPAAARRAATCSARRPPAPARPPPSRCRCSQRLVRGERPARAVALVLVPTRELAMQVAEAIHRYGRGLGARVAADLRRPAASAASCGALRARRRRRRRHARPRARPHPPRHAAARRRRPSSCSTRPTRCSTWASPRTSRRSSTTTPERAARRCCSRPRCRRASTAIAQRHLTRPGAASRSRPRRPAAGEAPLVRQTAYVVPRGAQAGGARPRARRRVTRRRRSSSAARRNEVDELTETLNGRGYRAEALHGGMSQEQRDRVMERLRGGTADLLVATDVAARGLDIEQLTHVVNYDVPSRARVVRAPHRPRRPRRAAKASPSRWPSRASTACCKNIERRHRPEDRDREGARPSPTCAPGGSS